MMNPPFIDQVAWLVRRYCHRHGLIGTALFDCQEKTRVGTGSVWWSWLFMRWFS